MPPSIVVVIRADPRQSGRAVEALRIALGLGAGDNPMTVVLLDHARLLLSEETDEIIDGDILEKHLPVFKELQIPFLVQQSSRSQFSFDADFKIGEVPKSDIAESIASADRVLVFD